MTFDKRQWISEMIAGSITSGIAGVIAAIFVPDPPYAVAAAAGGVAGLTIGLLNLPLRWLLDWHPRVKHDKSVRSITAKRVEKQSSMNESPAKRGK
jgi:hypothetical protein